jgi:hypothetical protein
MSLSLSLAVVLLVFVASCVARQVYNFTLTHAEARRSASGVDAVEDSLIRFELALREQQIELGLTNKTTTNLQVSWSEITLELSDGSSTRLRNDRDLGWVAPGDTVVTHLMPLALPADPGDQVGLTLQVPVTVNYERVLYRFPFVARRE